MKKRQKQEIILVDDVVGNRFFFEVFGFVILYSMTAQVF